MQVLMWSHHTDINPQLLSCKIVSVKSNKDKIMVSRACRWGPASAMFSLHSIVRDRWLRVCPWGLKKQTEASALTCLRRYWVSKREQPTRGWSYALHTDLHLCNAVNKSNTNPHHLSFSFSHMICREPDSYVQKVSFCCSPDSLITLNSFVRPIHTTDGQKGRRRCVCGCEVVSYRWMCCDFLWLQLCLLFSH